MLDYKNMPYLVGKYLTPDDGELTFVVKYGNALIALMVGVYSWLALTFNVNGMTGAARILEIWLLVEVFLSLSVLFKQDREKNE